MSKTKRNFRRIVLGDVVEIPLSKGYAYAQYVNCHRKSPRHGELIRVFPTLLHAPLSDLGELLTQTELYCCFCPVGIAVSQKMVRIVGNAPVPTRCRKLPHFKSCNKNYETGKKTWFIWDGKATRSVKVDKLSAAEKKYPMKEIVNIPLLVERIEEGWLPEHEV